MHICIPDIREVRPSQRSAYLLYNVHIDGLYHCSLRYKQLLHLHQTLLKAFASTNSGQLPPFPPKKLLPLSGVQVEERRLLLEKYLQNISQDKAICSSPIFNLFLLEAQRESTRIREDQVHLDIELVNGQKIRLQIVTHDSADAILTVACRALGLNDRYHAYFCLCLCGYDVVRDKLIIKRRFSFFESPYITLQMAIQQQEQIQNVLAATSYSNGLSSNNNNTTNSVISPCRYCSCTNHAHLRQANNVSTAVPHLGSSSGSNPSTNQGHHNQQHNLNQSLQVQQNGSKNQYQDLQTDPTTARTLSSSISSSTSSSSSSSSSTCCYRNGRHPTTLSRTTLARNFVTHRILLRKSYWDPIYDTYILSDQQALNLLFIQTVYDMQHSLMFVDRKTYHRLDSLLAADAKLEYILLARTLKYYNYVHFEPCLSDYPRPRTKVMISIGSKELNMRVLKSPLSLSSSSTAIASKTSSSASVDNMSARSARPQPPSSNQTETDEHVLYCTSSLVPTGYQHLITRDDLVEEEYDFKVSLIRCWRLTSLETLNSNSPAPPSSVSSTLRRKSLSLFGGNSNNSNSTSSIGVTGCSNRLSSSYNVDGNRNLISSGFGGNSLFAALSSATTAPSHSSICSNEQQLSSGNLDKQQHQVKRECCACHLMQRNDHNLFSQYELSFEYLISKDTLRWITISSDQAIFISISLQGVVDELVNRRNTIACLPFVETSSTSASSLKNNSSIHTTSVGPCSLQSARPQDRGREIERAPSLPHLISPASCANQTQSFSYMFRDGSQKSLTTGNQQLLEKFGMASNCSSSGMRQRHNIRSSSTSGLVSLINGNNSGIGFNSNGYNLVGYPGGSNSSYQRHHSNGTTLIERPQNATIFEISNFKKAPSPIINDAFEGVPNDDDL